MVEDGAPRRRGGCGTAHSGREAAWWPGGRPGGLGRGAPRGLKGGGAEPGKGMVIQWAFFCSASMATERLYGKNLGGRNA